jgi:hypothetical protein
LVWLITCLAWLMLLGIKRKECSFAFWTGYIYVAASFVSLVISSLYNLRWSHSNGQYTWHQNTETKVSKRYTSCVEKRGVRESSREPDLQVINNQRSI